MKYDKYANQLGFIKKDDKVYIKNVFDFNIYLKDWEYSLLNVESIYVPLDRPLNKSILDKLTKIAKDNVCVAYSLGNPNDTLIITLPSGNKAKKANLINEIINDVLTYLRDKGYLKMRLCPICKKEAKYNIFGDNYCPLHSECKIKYVNALKEKNVIESKFSYKYVLAILFTIIGALIGILPVLLLTIYNNDYLFGGMVCFSPILATIGYALAKAPSKKWLRITFGLIVFVIVLSVVIFAQIYIPSKLEISYADYIKYNGYTGLRRLIFGIILSFGGFGCLRTLKKFKKDNDNELKKFED